MTGNDTFNQEFLQDFTQCLADLDLNLPDSINAQWKGFKSYAASQVYPTNDTWKRCSELKNPTYEVRVKYKVHDRYN